MMTTPVAGVERRVGQRFPFNLPVFLRDIGTTTEGLGFTQDLSSRGAFLFTTMALKEGAEIELTLRMPSEITLGENMRVRCRARVLRVVNAADNGWKSLFTQSETKPAEPSPVESTDGAVDSTGAKSAETKIGVAVCLKGYEYLPETEDRAGEFRRISALHGANDAECAGSPATGEPRTPAH
jgi:hypothetical protein